MTEKVQLNTNDLARLLWVPIGMAALLVVTTLVFREPYFILAYELMAAIAYLMRLLLMKLPSSGNHQFTSDETMATVMLAWLIIALLSANPFWCAPWLAGSVHNVSVFRSPLNGLFEAMSDIKNTGLSMVPKVSELPASLQFWRSLMEWIGGVGIALLMITLLNVGSDSDELFRSELNKSLQTDASETARWIWWIYAILTVLSVALFWGLGMPW